MFGSMYAFSYGLHTKLVMNGITGICRLSIWGTGR